MNQNRRSQPHKSPLHRFNRKRITPAEARRRAGCSDSPRRSVEERLDMTLDCCKENEL